MVLLLQSFRDVWRRVGGPVADAVAFAAFGGAAGYALVLSSPALVAPVAVPLGPGGGARAAGAEDFRLFVDDPFLRTAAPAVGDDPAAGGEFLLHSTRVAGGGEASAIVSGKSLPQTPFRVGEQLAPGVVLAAVNVDSVEIDRSGRREVLYFSRRIDAGTGRRESAGSVTREALLRSMSLRPVARDGRLAGFELMARGDASAMRALGLEPGDLLTGVNGAEISAGAIAAQREQLLSGARMELRVERQGQSRVVTIEGSGE